VAAPESIPLFPLHTVLFPGAALPLHIFEERYRLLVRARLDFGVVLIRHGRESGAMEANEIHRVGTLARFQEVEELPDGRFVVVARGLRRFRVLGAIDRSLPYLSARVEMMDEPSVRAGPRLPRLFERYLSAVGLEVQPQLDPDVGRRAVWLVGSVLQAEVTKRQRLLEEGDASLAEALLEEELARLSNLGRLGVVPPRPPSPN
jgi:Lon protease-like protein